MKNQRRSPLKGTIQCILTIIFILTMTSCNTTIENETPQTQIIDIKQEHTSDSIKTEEVKETKQQYIKKQSITQQRSDNHNKVVDVTTIPIQTNTSMSTESSSNTYLGNFRVSAYCACAQCCGKSDGITATGTRATAGRTIAVDPSRIPYGTKVVIDGHTYIAEDCGGVIKGDKIDIYFDSHQEALNWGIKYKDVSIVV